MAQVAEHILGKDEVTSSNLVISSKKPVTLVVTGFFVFAGAFPRSAGKDLSIFVGDELCAFGDVDAAHSPPGGI